MLAAPLACRQLTVDFDDTYWSSRLIRRVASSERAAGLDRERHNGEDRYVPVLG